MTRTSCAFLLLTTLVITFAASPAGAEGLASPWVEGFNNKARLIAGRLPAVTGESGPGKLATGLQIEMPAGWKTYWRAPGEAGGVPPEFDWSGSENLAEAKVLYPAPHRLIDKSGAAIGYKEKVIFPVTLTAKDPAQPIILKLKASYGACKELCVPAEVELQINVPPSAASSDELNAVIATVPHSAPASTDPTVAASRVDMRDGKPFLVFDVIDPAGTGGDAFVDTAGGVYLPLPKKISETAGKAVYEVNLTDGADIKELKGKPITVTLTGTKGQSETSIKLP
jgi:DsbC/DsbD-like thiol-disulfide interchange protein